jgi:hypothetical protein
MAMGFNGQQRIVRGYGLHEQLKEHKPSQLVAVDADGGEVKIAVPDVRNKHARVMTALREVAWVRCDLLDKKGQLLYRHHRNADDRDAPATELEELPPTRAAAEMAGLLSLMLRAQETVLVQHQRATAESQQAMLRVVESALRRLELQESQIEHAMRLNFQLSNDLVNATLAQLQLPAASSTDAEGNPRPQSDKAIEALMPHILRGMLQPTPKPQPQPQQKPAADEPKKKNGVNGSTTKAPSPGPTHQGPSTPNA